MASIRHDLSQTVQFKDPRDVEDGVKRMCVPCQPEWCF